MFRKLMWLARQIGFTDGRILDPAFDGRRAELQVAAHLPDGQARIHLFAASFDSEDAAEVFCLGDGSLKTPEQITQELDEATIDTTYLEIVYGGIDDRLAEFLDTDTRQRIMAKKGDQNTLIIMTEEAFSGLPFMVHDTATLTYLGAEIVAV